MALSNLPDELILSIGALLEPEQIIPLQLVSKRFYSLARDDNLWKEICFDQSRFEATRRRREWLAAQEEQLVLLRQAVQGISSPDFSDTETAQTTSNRLESNKTERRNRALLNWDPEYPGEQLDFYQEYMHRHRSIAVDWFEESKVRRHDVAAEAMGVGTLVDSQGVLQRVVAPMDNGSLCIWEASSECDPQAQGRIIAKSSPGFLSVQPDSNGHLESITNETGAIENVGVDSKQQKGYFAIHDTVSEVDLNTLQVINRRQYAFSVSCISAAEPLVPMTIGTTHTMHLFGMNCS